MFGPDQVQIVVMCNDSEILQVVQNLFGPKPEMKMKMGICRSFLWKWVW